MMKVGQERHCYVEFGYRRLELIEVMKFFGVMISGDGRLDERIGSRTGKAARVIGVLNEPVWKWTKLSRRTKLRVYNAIVVATLMY